MNVSERVRASRKAAGMSQRQLAEKAGVSRATVARIEAGKPPSVATLTRVTVALGLKIKVEC